MSVADRAGVAGEAMFELLLAAAATYLVLGALGEASMLGGSALIALIIARWRR